MATVGGVSRYRRMILSAAVGLAALAANVRVAEANVYYVGRNGCGSTYAIPWLGTDGAWLGTGCDFSWYRDWAWGKETWCLRGRGRNVIGCLYPGTSWYAGYDANWKPGTWYRFSSDSTGWWFRYYDVQTRQTDILCSNYQNFVQEKGDGLLHNPYNRVIGSSYIVHPAGNYIQFTPSCP